MTKREPEPVVSTEEIDSLDFPSTILNPTTKDITPNLLPSFIDGLQSLMGNTFALSRHSHATLSDSSELEAWEIQGKVESKLMHVEIQISYIDFHFFALESHVSTFSEMVGSAPVFRVPIRPCTLVTSADSLTLLRKKFDFLNKKVRKSVSQKIWELYSNGNFKEAYQKITWHIKRLKQPLPLAFYSLWAAWTAEKSTLLKKSAELYEEVASLFGFLNMSWFSHFCLQKRLELEKPLVEKIASGMTSDIDVEEMSVTLPKVPPEILTTPEHFDYDTYRALFKKTLAARTNKEKKETLETLAGFIFSSIDKNISVLPNVRTTTEEIDLLLRNESSTLFWQRLGSPVLVECKNWSTPVGINVLRDFKGKMETQGTRYGILISMAGITGNIWRGAVTYLKEQRMIGYFIIILDRKDLEDIASRVATPAEKISEKYYWLFTI